MDKPAFTGTRLQIARLLADRKMTLYEIARELGRTPGSIRGTVHRMTDEGLLASDSKPPVRGSEFTLNPLYLERLEEDLANDSTPGVLLANQQMLLVDAKDRVALYELLARPALSGSVAWITDFDGAGTRLIAVAAEADELDVERLVYHLQDVGFAVQTGRLGTPMEADAIRRFAASMRSRRAARL